MKGFRRLGWIAALIALGAALVQELRAPAAERTWHGVVAGVVPYDLRPPTLDRLRATFWNPDGPLVVEQAFGVGWTVNVGRLARQLRQA